jgi:DNA polymerase elongation subunit (family B)
MKFQILDWSYYHKDNDDNNSEDSDNEKENEKDKQICQTYNIRLFGRNEDNKSIYVDVSGFCPYFYLELPDTFKNRDILSLVTNIKTKVYPRFYRDGFLGHEYLEGYKMWGFTAGKKFKFLKLIFRDKDTMKAYDRIFKKPIKVVVYLSLVK